MGFWGNHRGDSPLSEDLDQRIGVVSLVAQQCIWNGIVDERLGASEIMSLAWREHQLDGIAQGVDEHVNFGG